MNSQTLTVWLAIKNNGRWLDFIERTVEGLVDYYNDDGEMIINDLGEAIRSRVIDEMPRASDLDTITKSDIARELMVDALNHVDWYDIAYEAVHSADLLNF